MVRNHSKTACALLKNLQLYELDREAKEHEPYFIATESFNSWSPTFPLTDEDRQEFIENKVKSINNSKSALPTDLEDPVAYRIYKDVVDRLLNQCSTNKFKLPENIYVGTTASRRLQANVQKIDGNDEDYLIAISRQIIPFCHLFGGFLAEIITNRFSFLSRSYDFESFLLPKNNEYDLLFKIIHNMVGEIRFEYDNFEIYKIFHDGIAARRPHIHLTEDACIVRTIITNAMEHFILGHELAHLIIGKLPLDELELEASESDLDRLRFLNYREEHMCDIIGNQLAAQAIKEIFKSMPHTLWYNYAILAGPLFLTCLHASQRMASVLCSGIELNSEVPKLSGKCLINKGSDTHPPTYVRYEFLMMNISQSLYLDNFSSKYQTLNLAGSVEKYFDNFWMNAKNNCYRIHAEFQSFFSKI